MIIHLQEKGIFKHFGFNPDEPRGEHGRWVAGGPGNGIHEDENGKRTEHWPRDASGKIDFAKIKEAAPSSMRTPLPETDPRLKEHPTPKDEEDKIVHETLKDAKPSDHPIAILTAGGNGSGKSTSLEETGVTARDPSTQSKYFGNEGHVVVNPDEIKTSLSHYQELKSLGDQRAARAVHEESSRIGNRVLDEAIANRNHILIDKTLENTDKADKVVDRLKKEGYEVHMIGVSTHPDIAEARAIARGERTGRYVPHEIIQKVHSKVNANWDHWASDKRLASFRHFENSDAKPMITTYSRNGETKVHNQELWNTVRSNYGKGGIK